ncbi:MAG TPA: glycosyltransferase family 4 protein [Tepidisphaeraceae bacterium]|nr:glycosyltransferase family 4 protein [Tepidisphaeraceae bacterium]
MLHRARLLERFYTDLSASAWWLRSAKTVLPEMFKPAALKRLLARRIEGVPSSLVTHFCVFGIQRVLERERTGSSTALAEQTLQANRQFCSLVNAKGFGEANAIYAFNGAALEMFESAKERGMLRILEQTSAPVEFDERLLAEERMRWHGWEPGNFNPKDWQPWAQREREEWELADIILCGSTHILKTLGEEGGPLDRCAVVPYGVNARAFTGSPRPRHDRPLRILAVGNITLRKGFQYLIQAARELRNQGVVCRVVGQPMVNEAAIRLLQSELELAGVIARDRMAEQYAWADVLVLPSLSEGSANVCYEALSCGLPVITTENAGSVVRDGIDGLIIPIRSSEAIIAAVNRLDSDRALLAEMAHEAVLRAGEYSWDRYAERLVSVVTGAFESGHAVA